MFVLYKVSDGTSFVTMLPAAIIAFSPIIIPGRIVAFADIVIVVRKQSVWRTSLWKIQDIFLNGDINHL